MRGIHEATVSFDTRRRRIDVNPCTARSAWFCADCFMCWYRVTPRARANIAAAWIDGYTSYQSVGENDCPM
jgi:hypothetical protein